MSGPGFDYSFPAAQNQASQNYFVNFLRCDVMAMNRDQLVRDAASRGKYAPLYRHLTGMTGTDWRASFGEIEKILGFRLPDSARLYRPWWSNQKRGAGHSHALAWQAAGWKTQEVDIEEEVLRFTRREVPSGADGEVEGWPKFSIDQILPPYDPGPWPEGFSASRNQIYDIDGR